MINERTLLISGPADLPSLPRVERLAIGLADEVAYRRDTALRRQPCAAIQVGLGGRLALFDAKGRIERELGPGRALVFVVPRHRVIYGVPPHRTAPYTYLYANLEGESALAIVTELVAAHGHDMALDPRHPAVRAIAALAPGDGLRQRRLTLPDGARLANDLICALITANCVDDGRDARLVETAMELLRRNLSEPVRISAIARRCGVSREHLSRAFTRACGAAPATWLRRLRLRQAEALLNASDLPVAAIARQCGFATASHFAQAFRHEHGRRPREEGRPRP